MTDDRKRKTGGEVERLHETAYRDSAVAVTVRTEDLKEVLRALAESRAECRKWREKYEDAWAEVGAQSEARAFAEARAERLAEYVEHREDCRHYHYIAEKCDCGLDVILSQEPTP